ncbi:MAG: hypothetical protein ACLP4R_12930 [Solirubrobacteraceae bacterium]
MAQARGQKPREDRDSSADSDQVSQPARKTSVGTGPESIQNAFKKQTPARLYRETFAQWACDGKTRATSSIPAGPYEELDRIEVPFVALEDVGAFNFHQFGAFDVFENAGTPPSADADTDELAIELPEGGTNSWPAAPFGAIMPSGLDEVANPTLTFETQFQEATELTGPIVLSLRRIRTS